MLAALDLLAILLLFGPIEEKVELQPPVALLSQLKWHCTEVQVLDDREGATYFFHATVFQSDLMTMRERIESLRGAPLVQDAERLPTRSTIDAYLAFNLDCYSQMHTKLDYQLHKNQEIREAINEINKARWIWELTRDARSEFYHLTVRRYALQKLRDRIGEEAYYSGNLPSYVPFSLFRPID